MHPQEHKQPPFDACNKFVKEWKKREKAGTVFSNHTPLLKLSKEKN